MLTSSISYGSTKHTPHPRALRTIASRNRARSSAVTVFESVMRGM
jgi:hypothetical protein